MIHRYLIIDGMLSGTGLRDGAAGGYVDPSEIEISSDLVDRLAKWLSEYENAHYFQFKDEAKNEELDKEGIGIAQQVREECPGFRIEYFSNAKLKTIEI